MEWKVTLKVQNCACAAASESLVELLEGVGELPFELEPIEVPRWTQFKSSKL